MRYLRRGCAVSEVRHSDREPQGLPIDRLESWKEIAAFFQRDVRTVQRWEKHAGLPVRRHVESRLRTPYAYRSELETWRRAQRTVVEAASEPELGSGQPSSAKLTTPARTFRLVRVLGRRQLVALSVIGIMALIGVAAAIVFRPAPVVQSVSPISPPIAVLFTKFEDQAGDPHLAGAIEEAVTREVTGGGNLEAVAPTRIARTLRLMRREPGSPLTEALGREVAVRDGHIRFVLTGRIHKLHSRYFADVKAVEPDSRVRVSLEWQAASSEQLLVRSAQESKRLVKLLGEAAVGQQWPAETLEPVTSTSTAAVGLYSAAVQAGRRRQWAASELLARRAISVDAEFASAHAWTGWAIRRQGQPIGASLPLLERAIELSNRTTDRETYLISGMSQSVAGDMARAAGALEAVLRLHPRDRQALDLLIDVSWRTGRVNRAVDLSVARAEYYADDFFANVKAAQALTTVKGSRDRAALFATRADKLGSAEILRERVTWIAWLQVLPVFHHWISDDSGGALDLLTVLERSLKDRVGAERNAFASAIGFAQLAFGRTKDAERVFRYESSPERQMNLAMLAIIRGDEETARQWLRQVAQHSALRPALFAHVGLAQEAERGLHASVPSEHTEGIAAVTRGLLAVHRRQFNSATSSLREGAQLLRATGEPEFFLAIEALARMARARGAIDQATRLLSEADAERAHTYGPTQWTGGYWTKLSTDLVEILRQQGHDDEAARVTAELRKVLVNVDVQRQAPGVVRSAQIR